MRKEYRSGGKVHRDFSEAVAGRAGGRRGRFRQISPEITAKIASAGGKVELP